MRSGEGRRAGLTGGLLVALLLTALLLAAMLSLALGATSLSPGVVWHALIDHRTGLNRTDLVIVREIRVPRTLLAMVVGAALGVAGAVMQAVSRNPLADPGILGVNAGAAVAVVIGIGLFGLRSPAGYVGPAMVGAASAAVAVYAIAARGAVATPVRLALAGTAITFAVGSVVNALVLIDPATFDNYRFWAVGSVGGRGTDVLYVVAPLIGGGLLVAFGLAGSLNALALGDDAARALGVHLVRTRVAAVIAVMLLCGAAVAGAGPLAFVGLAVAHVARLLVGADQRWILAISALLGPILLLSADLIGRLVARPAELEVGIVTAFLGAPVLIVLVRRNQGARA